MDDPTVRRSGPPVCWARVALLVGEPGKAEADEDRADPLAGGVVPRGDVEPDGPDDAEGHRELVVGPHLRQFGEGVPKRNAGLLVADADAAAGDGRERAGCNVGTFPLVVYRFEEERVVGDLADAVRVALKDGCSLVRNANCPPT